MRLRSPQGYKRLPDTEIVPLAQSGDNCAAEELLRRHDGLIFYAYRGHGLLGCDVEDLRQIGRIGLLSAIRMWRPHRGRKFSSFAVVCIRSAFHHVNAAQTRQKRYGRICEVSLEEIGGREAVSWYADASDLVRDDSAANPLHLILEREACDYLIARAVGVMRTDRNLEIVRRLIGGESVIEIAHSMGTGRQNIYEVVGAMRRHLAQRMPGGRLL